jgi:hypothetical protein
MAFDDKIVDEKVLWGWSVHPLSPACVCVRRSERRTIIMEFHGFVAAFETVVTSAIGHRSWVFV